MFKLYLLRGWVFAIWLSLCASSGHAEPVQLRLKLHPGDKFVYRFESHESNPAMEYYIRTFFVEKARLMDLYKGGQKSEVVIAQEEEEVFIANIQ